MLFSFSTPRNQNPNGTSEVDSTLKAFHHKYWYDVGIYLSVTGYEMVVTAKIDIIKRIEKLIIREMRD